MDKINTLTLAELKSAQSYSSLAEIFGIPQQKLASSLYGKSRNYVSFEILKRGGGARLIDSPIGVCRIIQSLLAPLLASTYKATDSAHGFIRGRSIVSNAKMHVGKRTIINIDIVDFFNTISFKRIRGIFLAEPYRLTWAVATILAQACCCEGRLPAGGISSPTLSNIILSRLDKKFSMLIAKLGGVYTRYCDDLTFSFLISPDAQPRVA